VGKTTVLMRVVEGLNVKHYSVGGMMSQEVRSEDGFRVGFEILDLHNSRRGWLASVNEPNGPQVGKYRVNLEDLDSIGVEAIAEAVERLDVVVIDEVGPMELFSDRFQDAVKRAIVSTRLVVGVVHWNARGQLIGELKARADSEVIVVTPENREKLHEVLMAKAIEFLEHS